MNSDQLAQELVEKKTYTRLFWDVMNYQLFEVNSHAFSLSRILILIFFLILGFFISKRAAKGVENRVLVRMQIDDSLRFALGRFIFYLFVAISTLFTLHVCNVPITVFAVIGSAVAIGIGFGSQNVIYNFISGLLIMIERPIRLGDYIELEGLAGTVKEIGIRSTVLLSPNNALVVVPNTLFLEKSVVNWTLGDELQCGSVRISVGASADARQIEAFSLEAATHVPKILQEKGVSVTFSDCGGANLIFDVGFWCIAHTTGQRKSVESDLRFALLATFQAHQTPLVGVTAHPVLLQSPAPLQIRVLEP